MIRRILAVLSILVGALLSCAARAESVPVDCVILPGEMTASVSLANPLSATASCQANCKFATPVYDDNPQIICAKLVPAGKRVEMCRLNAAGNKFTKLVSGTANCVKP